MQRQDSFKHRIVKDIGYPCYLKSQIKLKNSDNYGQGEEVERFDPILLIHELLLCKLGRLGFSSGFQKFCVKKDSWSAL